MSYYSPEEIHSKERTPHKGSPTILWKTLAITFGISLAIILGVILSPRYFSKERTIVQRKDVLPSGLNVALPKVHTVEQREKDNIVVTIDTAFMIAIDDKKTSLEKGFELLTEKIRENPDKQILIKADSFVLWEAVKTLLRFAKCQGANKVAIGVTFSQERRPFPPVVRESQLRVYIPICFPRPERLEIGRFKKKEEPDKILFRRRKSQDRISVEDLKKVAQIARPLEIATPDMDIDKMLLDHQTQIDVGLEEYEEIPELEWYPTEILLPIDVKLEIYLTKDGSICINDSLISDDIGVQDSLMRELLIRSPRQRACIISADERLYHYRVVDMIVMAKQCGAERVCIMKRKKGARSGTRFYGKYR